MKRLGKIVIEENKIGEYYFKIKAPNGRILCHSESYFNLYGCKKAIKSLLGHQYIVYKGDKEIRL